MFFLPVNFLAISENCSVIGLQHIMIIITRPQLLSCHIINFTDHIPSYFASDHSPCHSFPSDHSPSHSYHLLKSIAFRFTIYGWTHVTSSFNPIVMSTF